MAYCLPPQYEQRKTTEVTSRITKQPHQTLQIYYILLTPRQPFRMTNHLQFPENNKNECPNRVTLCLVG